MNGFPVARRYFAGAAVILGTGLAAAAVVYHTAAEAPPNNAVQGFLESKRYLHDVRTYGGTISVVADDMSQWFVALWQGEQLAYSIVVITIVLSALAVVLGWCAGSGEAR